MLATVQSCAVVGLEGTPIVVEVDVSPGMAGKSTLVGLPDAAVRESLERVRAALFNSNLFYPSHRLTINLAPADVKKEGPVYDLPIAVGILLVLHQISANLSDAMFIGELGLDGSVRHVSGILPLARLARDIQIKRLFVPAMDAMEAALMPGVEVYPVTSLAELVEHFRGKQAIAPMPPTIPAEAQESALNYTTDSRISRARNMPNVP